MQWLALLFDWQKQIEEHWFLSERRAIESWVLKSGKLLQHECILFYFYEKEYRWFQDGKWHAKTTCPNDAKPAFVVVSSGIRGMMSPAISPDQWHPIYASKSIALWESYDRHASSSYPLRFGLSMPEKDFLLKQARKGIENLLKNAEANIELGDQRFQGAGSVGITIWYEGKLSACVIQNGASFAEAFTAVLKKAMLDERFQIKTIEQFAESRIEISLLGDLEFPLRREEVIANEISIDKGYILRDEKQKAYYLPVVHNDGWRRPIVLQQFLMALKNKARIGTNVHYSQYQKFSVSGFIEDSEKTASLDLSGPLMKPSIANVTPERVRKMLEEAVCWLEKLQREDGSLPLIAGHYDYRFEKEKDDWIRSIFTLLALVEFSSAHQNKTAERVAKRLYGHLSSHAPFRFLQSEQGLLALTYFNQVLLFYPYDTRLRTECVRRFVSLRKSIQKVSPITELQVLAFLWKAQRAGMVIDDSTQESLSERTREVLQEFERVKGQPNFPLPYYPELIHVLFLAARVTKNQAFDENAKTVATWYSSRQFEQGGFPDRVGSDMLFIRGTGKIFETLACYSEWFEREIERILSSLIAMQYGPDNMYSIPLHRREALRGGFRHDAINKDAWIDAAGHVILGGSRWLSFLEKQEKDQ